MRILYIDIDSLRPDHLGCYGYHRKTSPNIDKVAAEGVRMDNFYATDVPCLPSRTALFSGRAGIHNGVINHGGVASEMFNEGVSRDFESTLGQTSWMRCLRNAGLKTVTVSPFGERHSAWHWYANFNEVYNTGKCGLESGEEAAPVAIDWIDRNGADDDWFLHVNLWDPHTPYRAPEEVGEPFADDPIPAWLTEDVWKSHWEGCGPHGAQEVNGYDTDRTTFADDYPRQPTVADSMDQVRRMFDGYDTGVLWSDHWVGEILKSLEKQGVLDETVIMISSDHGEALGEFNIYGDHQVADESTSCVPLIVRWPGVTDGQGGRVDSGLHYHYDFAATMIELLGGEVPSNWDGVSFAEALKKGEDSGREYLVLSQGAWSCQRSVRWDDYICIRSYHDGHHAFPDEMLFDLANDPYEQTDLADEKPELVREAMAKLDEWTGDMMRSATNPSDPMRTVMTEGGPLHTRGELPAYLKRLRATGRGKWADILERKHPREANPGPRS